MLQQDSEGIFRFDARTDEDELVSALREVFKTTDVGQDYFANYRTEATADSDANLVLNAAVRVAGGFQISVNDLAVALSLLIQSGQIRPKNFKAATPFTEPKVDTRPKDKNGNVLSESQLRWSEYRKWSETHTMDQCRARAKSDEGFETFMHKNLEREFAASPVPDAVTPLLQPQGKKATQELIVFAKKYYSEKSENLKPKGGYVVLAGEQLLYKEFVTTVNQMIAMGL